MIKPSTHPGRVILALLASSFVGCIAGILSIPYFVSETVSPPSIGSFIEMLLVIWVVTLPVSLVFGALAHWALLRLKFWPVTAYTITGMALGPIAIIVWDFATSRSFSLQWLPPELTWLGVITGGVTALTFRILVHKTSDSASFPPAGTRPY